MAAGQKLVIAMVMALVTASAVHADLMPVGQPQSSSVCPYTPVLPTGVESECTQASGDAALDLVSVDVAAGADADAGQIRQAEPLQILAYEPGSLNLCLYALIGLGLCRSAPWVKKLSLGFVPDWYYDGGPYQIGHSHAIGPESLCFATVRCFVQPDCAERDLIPQYYLGKVASLLHKSLFVPGRLASRGPPACV